MPASEPDSSPRADPRQDALQCWDTEGGAGPGRLPAPASIDAVPVNAPPISSTERVQLQTRVIVLENLVVSLLARANDADLERVRDMAAQLAPRTGLTPHPLNIGAAREMLRLLERSRLLARSGADGTP